MYRHDTGLIAYQPLPGEMKSAPKIVAKYFLGAAPGSTTAAALRPNEAGDVVMLARGQLRAFDAHARELWTADTPGYDIAQVLWIDDLDADGKNEIVAVANHVGQTQQAYVILDAATGKKRGAIDIVTGDYGFRGKIGSFLPHSKAKQIVIVTSAKQAEVGMSSNGEIALWSLEPNAGPKRLWSYKPPEFTLFYPHLMVGPLGAHGEPQAVIDSWCHVWNIDLATGKVVNHETWDPHASSPRQYGWSELVDADGDGHLDYVNVSLTKHVDMLKNTGGQLKLAWTHGWTDAITTEQRALRPMCEPIVDLDGDGKMEVVAGLFDGLGDKHWHLYVWDGATGAAKSETLARAPLDSVQLDRKSKTRTMLCSHSMTVQFDPPTPLEAWQDQNGKLTKVWEHGGVRLVQDAAPETDTRVTSDTSLQTGFARMITTDDGKPAFETTDIEGGATRAWGLDDNGQIIEKKLPSPIPGLATPATPPLPQLAGTTVPFLLAGDVYNTGHNNLILYDNATATITKLDDGTITPIEKIPSAEIPTICDLLGDGKPVLLTGGRTETRDCYVAARDSNKKELWRYVFPQSAGCGQYSDRPVYTTVGHFTGSKNLDVFTFSMKPQARAYLLDGKTGQPIWRKEEVPKIERHYQEFGGRACIYDYNHDGCDDIFFANPDYYCVGSGKDGSLLVGPIFVTDIVHFWSAYSSPTILDRDNNPFVYLAGAYSTRASISIDGTRQLFRDYLPTERWPLLIDMQRFTEGLLPPSKINNHWRVAYLESDGTLRAFEADTGKKLWSLPLHTNITSIVSGDVDNDGEPDLLFGGRDGNLYCVRDDGVQARIIWKLSLGAPIASVILADVANTGKSAIAASVADGNVYVLHE